MAPADWRLIASLLTPSERHRAVGLLLLMVGAMALETLGIGLVIPATAILVQDDLAASYPILAPVLQALGNPSRGQLVVGGMLTLVALFVVKALFVAWMTWRQNRFAFDVQANLSRRLFETYLHQPYTFLLNRNSAELIRNTVTEVGLFTSYAIVPTMLLLTEGLVLFGIASLLLAVEPIGAVAVVTVTATAAWVFQRSTRGHLARWGAARQHHEGLRLQHLQQGLGGAKDVKLLGREADFLRRYDEHNVKSARMGEYNITLLQIPRLWLELLAVIGLATLVLTMLARGRDLNGLAPALGLFGAAAFRLMPSVNRVLNALQQLRYATPVVQVLHHELNMPRATAAAGGGRDCPFDSEIRIDRVQFTYPGASSPALEGVTLVIQKGESVGFVGPSGSGKSTLVDTILGLLTPQAGRVLVDGCDIKDALRAWQNRIGCVPQSIYLTDDSLRRNVAFGLPDHTIDEAAVWRAVRAAQLEAFVRELPRGLDTLVGERGVRLSGGQRQRIGIARALYHDPSVLVLDEATSALDTATERDVMQTVKALQGKTVIIVAHRLTTVEQCDRLYRLERGRIVAEGRPAELVPLSAG